jgi:DNA-binding MarR family transcriptional regulator
VCKDCNSNNEPVLLQTNLNLPVDYSGGCRDWGGVFARRENMARKKQIESAIVALLALAKEMRHCDEITRKLFNATAPQLSLLGELLREDERSINSLAESLHIHQSSVSALGKQLVKRGLVSRRDSKADNRSSLLSLTPKGRDLATRAGVMGRPLLSAGLEGIPGSMREELVAAVEELTATMEKAREMIVIPSIRDRHTPSAVVSRRLRLA